MSESLNPTRTPVKFTDLKPGWLANLKVTITRNQHEFRAGTDLSIEFKQAPNSEVWIKLNLPGETTQFASELDRSAAMEFLNAPEEVL